MDDPGRTRRVVASIAAAIAITALEAVVATRLWMHDTLPAPPAATSVVLERAAPTPRPTPRATPTPVPTPRPVARVTIVPVQRAAPRAERRAGGTATIVHATPVPRAATVAGVDHAPGGGSATGSGVAAGDASGGGSGGTGTGVIDADAPCGYVDFIPDERPRITGTTSYETIRATVSYPDGHTQSETFPYPWIYADYMQSDPWSPANVGKKNLVVFAQLPPPGANTRRYPEVIRYILDHTNPNGSTVLQPCPR